MEPSGAVSDGLAQREMPAEHGHRAERGFGPLGSGAGDPAEAEMLGWIPVISGVPAGSHRARVAVPDRQTLRAGCAFQPPRSAQALGMATGLPGL